MSAKEHESLQNHRLYKNNGKENADEKKCLLIQRWLVIHQVNNLAQDKMIFAEIIDALQKQIILQKFNIH